MSESEGPPTSFSAMKLPGVIYCFYFRWDTTGSLHKGTVPTAEASEKLVSLLNHMHTCAYAHTHATNLHSYPSFI